MVTQAAFWRGRRVLVTGHTGFKGGWLTLWLKELGASVCGLSLDPPTTPSLYEVARVATAVDEDIRGDIRDLDAVARALAVTRPSIVFHMAAQPLVRESYREPITTFMTNVMGTANVLEAARSSNSIEAIVIATTDKVYADTGEGKAFKEGDPLGGRDPYSGSKAAAEIVVSSYDASFFHNQASGRARIATVRAGNVIGGGDWAEDRLVPDCLAAFEAGKPVTLRYPNAIRPWQHVFEPLAGYLCVAERLAVGAEYFVPAWNFGPDAAGEANVSDVASAVAKEFGRGAKVRVANDLAPHETAILRLDNSLSKRELGWRPRWALDRAIRSTVEWRRAWRSGDDMNRVSQDQLAQYIDECSNSVGPNLDHRGSGELAPPPIS